MNITSKLPTVGTTIFTVMSQLAQAHDAINLSQGFPDFATPPQLVELVEKYMRAGHNQYPPMTGVPFLREQIAAKMQLHYGVTTDMDSEITVTSGATEALFVAIMATVGPGNEAIVLDPCYDAYEPAITLAGGLTRHIPLGPGFKPDWQAVADAVTDRTRLIVVNSPHNPSGSVFSAADLDALADIIADTRILLLSDEVYEHMVYDDARHLSLLTHPELRARCFVVSSFGKTYHATGWKVAYCIAPTEMTTEFRKIHQFVTFTTHTPSQWALAEFMASVPAHYQELPGFYQAKRDLFLAEMAGSRFVMTPTKGTYFQLADYSAISSMPDTEFARFLTTEVGVAAIPISVFYETVPIARVVRFCFCKSDDTLRQAAAKLRLLEHA
ncbi:MAG: methionine aminotransferase [Pseudomonadota bacterium]